MCLVLHQSPSGVTYTNDRGCKIPVTIQKAYADEISEMILYVSTNEGRDWAPASRISAGKTDFVFFATRDGPHWFRVAYVNKAGKQDPDEKSILTLPAEWIMVFDRRQPVIRSIQAQRQGDEVQVKWEIDEENPDPKGFRLEYQAKGGADSWTPIPAAFAPAGQARVRPGNNLALVVRLTMRDLANNQSYAQTEIAGDIATTSFNSGNTSAILPGPGQIGATPTLPVQIPIQPPVVKPEQPFKFPPMPTQDVLNHNVQSIGPPKDMGAVAPPPPLGPLPPIGGIENIGAGLPPYREKVLPKATVIADSRVQAPIEGHAYDPPADAGPATTARGHKLPDLIYVNDHHVTLEYELKRVGPSGVGGIEIWLTKNDGASWEPYAKANDAGGEDVVGRQKRTFEFLDKNDRPFADGIFGLTLVVKNRAGLSREPRPGDVPEMRIEIDSQKPLAILYQPSADPQNPENVLLKWTARDKNLAPAPIQLEYAEKPEGPWRPIKLDLENKGRYAGSSVTINNGVAAVKEVITGDYSWKVPSPFPVQVYLRIRVRDKAGNEQIAATRDAQFVDLVVPTGALITAHPTRP
jgi:hypothetical protein